MLYDAIGDRHTNRGPYADKAVPGEDLRGLVDVSDLPGSTVHWVTGDDARAATGRLMVDAATAITRDEQQSRDSFTWFRSSHDAIERYRTGSPSTPRDCRR